tara:strand:- start:37 stop:1314 length:1278 start_codon:yes stop_codon:yes gene_type:complete
MRSKKEIIKFIVYTTIFIPITIFILDITFLFINKSSTKLTNGTKYDSLTGWRENCNNKYTNPENYKVLICDRNGFIKTPYENDKKKTQTYGILLLGNSVAMGEGLYGFDNKKTFASQLEKNLRNQNPKIDLINAAYSGFNSWQEHVETFRYLNSEPFNDDLPPLGLIVSFGGIQDFWNFIRLLSKNDEKKIEYSLANGMMIDKNNIKYINFLTSSSQGNIRSGFIAFLNSIRKNSAFLSYIDNLRSKNKVKPGFYEKKQLTIKLESNIKNMNLREVLEKRLNLDYEEYEKIKNYAVQSTLRNISSTANLNLDSKYIYVYAPTYFSSLSERQLKSNDYKYLIGTKHLIGNPVFPLKILEREMHLIEKDYRETLLSKIKRNKKIELIDFSQKAENTNWFIDYSHFTEFAANELSSMLAIEILDIKNK